MEVVGPVALVEVVIPDSVVDDLRPGSEAARVLVAAERLVRDKASVLARESVAVVGLDPGKGSAPVRESVVVMGLDRVRGSETAQEVMLAGDSEISVTRTSITRTSMQIALDSGRGPVPETWVGCRTRVPTGRCLLRIGRRI